MIRRPGMQSQITFFYYPELAPAAAFYEEVLGLSVVMDQGWARIYHVSGGAFLGIVAGDKGFHRPQEKSAVLLTLVVDDAAAWYTYLQERGVHLLTELRHREDIQIRCFYLQDPGGYSIEIQEFLQPEVRREFGGEASSF
jgi:predicted enzyme related to lactoylglutathione lyase